MLYSTKNGITPNHLQTHKLHDLFAVILFGLYSIAHIINGGSYKKELMKLMYSVGTLKTESVPCLAKTT